MKILKSKNLDVLLKDVKGILQNLGKEIQESPLTPARGRAPVPSHTKPISTRLRFLVAACALLLIVAGLLIFMNTNGIWEADLTLDTGTLHPTTDAGTLLSPPTLTPVQAQANISVGDIIQFGDFDWRVLDVQGNQALIITDRIIDTRMYHHTYGAVTWETSEIRQWLNGDFFASFSPHDQARIAETYVINNDNPWDLSELGGWNNTPGGNNTMDRLFLLSIDEVLRYFGDSGLVAHGAIMNSGERDASALEGLWWWGIVDQYSETRIAHDLGDSASWWWLRSPGSDPNLAAGASNNGHLDLHGFLVV